MHLLNMYILMNIIPGVLCMIIKLLYFLLAGTTRLRPVLVNKSFLTAPESMQSHSKNDKNAS